MEQLFEYSLFSRERTKENLTNKRGLIVVKKVFFCILAVVISRPLFAQEAASLELLMPGDRVRISAPEFFQKMEISQPARKIKSVVGTVMAANPDTLFLKVDNQHEPMIISVPFASLKRLEVKRGKKSKIGSGAGVGFLVGAITGAAIFYNADEEGNDFSPENAALAAVKLGILIGAGIGLNMRSDRWEEVPLKRPLRPIQN